MALLRTLPISSWVSGEEKEESPESVIIRFRLQRVTIEGGGRAGTYLPAWLVPPKPPSKRKGPSAVTGVQFHRGRGDFWLQVQEAELWLWRWKNQGEIRCLSGKQGQGGENFRRPLR